MTYIQSSGGGGTSGDEGRFHIIKPDQSSPTYSGRYLRFDVTNTDGWCDRRTSNPSYGSADPDGWEVVRNDLNSSAWTGGYVDGYFEAGTYSVYLRHTHRGSSVGVSHLSYPVFKKDSSATVTTDLPSISNSSPVDSCPTTVLKYYEQGGLFHISLSLEFVFKIDGDWTGIQTYFMASPTNSWYNSTYANLARASYENDTGAECLIIKLD